jgi:hypothetical protein
MNCVFKVLVITALTALAGCQSLGREPLFRLTLQVVDNEGNAVEGADASFSAEARPRYAGDESGIQNGTSGRTNQAGVFTGEIEAWDGTRGGYKVAKEGYYPAWSTYGARRIEKGKWQPWNPTIRVVLKRIRNPVPMFAKRLWRTGLPKRDVLVAYDLELGDWVVPHGKGKIPDMIFVGTLREGGDRVYEWKLKLTFSNPGDGIQRFIPEPDNIVFRSPYEAPGEGYLPEWNLWRTRQGPEVREQNNYQEKGGYFFRVRTVLDSEGRVVKAMYGEIYGDFFAMVYYLNPDGTRNMEYDSKRNLLKWKDPRERNDYEVGP